MAELTYFDKHISVKGIWLIDAGQLEALDNILDMYWELMKNYKEKCIQEEIKTKINDNVKSDKERIESIVRSFKFSQDIKEIIIYLDGRKKVKAESFKEIIRDEKFSYEKSKNCSVILKCGEMNCTFAIEEDFDTQKLKFHVNHQELEISQDLMYSINKWVRSVKQPSWQKILSIPRFYLWIFLICFFIFSSILTNSVNTPQKIYSYELVKKGYELLQDSLSKDEENKALELLLKLNIGYVPPDYEITQSNSLNWVSNLQIFMIIVVFILSIRPTIILGIGRGENSIRRWRIYFKIVYFTIPSIILFYFILPYIYDRIFK